MHRLTRRDLIRAGIGTTLATTGLAGASLSSARANILPGRPGLILDASRPLPPPAEHVLQMGSAVSPDGTVLGIDSLSILRNGKRWLPVMGEMHYARYPEKEWRPELLKMKAGGVGIVSTYVFWIHQEEVEGVWDWSGRRNLRGFIETCHELHLPAVVRCGPWCHGEVRNGGFPDWLLTKGLRLRSDDPGYLVYCREVYGQIAHQLSGLLWKDGGPVLAIQCENEYYGPAQHLLTLKQIAIDSGLDVPFYTRTGWPDLSTPMPAGEMLPLFGVYPDGFWDRKLTTMPEGGKAYLFLVARTATTGTIATDVLGAQRNAQADNAGIYPYCCCEIGGGMETSYHRRILMHHADIESSALIKIGSGNNLQGYYMYHGGTNPDGKLSSLQETQATGGWNDMPAKTYDFDAPLGEFGQINPHYHGLRMLHLFLADWGASLAAMPAYVPSDAPADASDTQTLRWAARTDGHSGYLFVNNFQRFQHMPPKPSSGFTLNLIEGDFCFPYQPVDIPADCMFVWPFNMDLGAANLIYATARPICKVTAGDTECFVFGQSVPGIAAEFVFTGHESLRVESKTGTITRAGGDIIVRKLQPGTQEAITLTRADKVVKIILLDPKQSRACWKGRVGGRETVCISDAGLAFDKDSLLVSTSKPETIELLVLPELSAPVLDGTLLTPQQDGIFARYALPGAPHAQTLKLEQIRPAGPLRAITLGSAGVAQEPVDADFAGAATWRIALQLDIDLSKDLLLSIDYAGDVARLAVGETFIDDNFYNGRPFELGLSRVAGELRDGELRLEILPLQKGAPIYIQPEAIVDFAGKDSIAHVRRAVLIERVTRTISCS